MTLSLNCIPLHGYLEFRFSIRGKLFYAISILLPSAHQVEADFIIIELTICFIKNSSNASLKSFRIFVVGVDETI